MSWISNPVGTISKLLAHSQSMLDATPLDPATKAAMQSNLDSIAADLADTAETNVTEAVTGAEPVPVAETDVETTVETDVGEAVEGTVNTVITAEAPALAPEIVPLADALLSWAGGDLVKLIGGLMNHTNSAATVTHSIAPPVIVS